MLSFCSEGEQESGRKWERLKANWEFGALERGETEGQLLSQETIAWNLYLVNS
jgi:hypothetical protein